MPPSGGGMNSNNQLLDDVEAPTQSNTSSISTTPTHSLFLPRNSVPGMASIDDEKKIKSRNRARCISLSKSRSRPDKEDIPKKKGLRKWKPIRALSHFCMKKLSCLFSVEVVAVKSLPASLDGVRLSVCVHKKEAKRGRGAVQTMPSRVSQGGADFDETLFVRCYVHFTPGSGKRMKFEPRPFLIYVVSVDDDELDFGTSFVDLSKLIQESIENGFEGSRIRQRDMIFNLSGQAKGGELVLKLGFQLMEKDLRIGMYSQAESSKNRSCSSVVPSSRMSSITRGIDDMNLDEHVPPPPSNSPVQDPDVLEDEDDDLEFLEFEVVNKCYEMEDIDIVKEQSGEDSDNRSISSEVVNGQFHKTRLTEADCIEQQIKAIETMIEDKKSINIDESGSRRLDTDEETVTSEFIHMVRESGTGEFIINNMDPLELENEELSEEIEASVYIPDLGKGLGCVVLTRNGGYLAAMNPLNTKASKKDTPTLAMQISKPFVLSSSKSTHGFELFHMMGSLGPEGLGSEILSRMPMEVLVGKTAERIAFEGIASTIIQGRNNGASSGAARTIASVKSMSSAMSSGRKERISSGIWRVREDPLTSDGILPFSLQKIEVMAIEALKIQADIGDEESPFDMSPLNKPDHCLLASATPLEEFIKDHSIISSPDDDNGETSTISILVVIQLHYPVRQYEAVGGPMMVLIQATHSESKNEEYDEEKRFEVASLHVGGLRIKSGGGMKNSWDSEEQRSTATKWLVANGLGKKDKLKSSRKQDVLWSISSRILADMWLNQVRNPDIRFSL